MTDLFTSADQRKRERELEQLVMHQALLLTKALKALKGGGIIENNIKRQIKDALKRSRAA